MPVSAEYDREADALYVRLRDGERARTVEIDDSTYVDVDADGHVVGIELLYPAMGVNLGRLIADFGPLEDLAAIFTAIASSDAGVPSPTFTGGGHLANVAITTRVIEGTVPATAHVPSPSVAHADRFIYAGR